MYGLYGCMEIQLFENLESEKKKAFKVVQMEFIAIHFNNQKISFDIFKVGN